MTCVHPLENDWLTVNGRATRSGHGVGNREDTDHIRVCAPVSPMAAYQAALHWMVPGRGLESATEDGNLASWSFLPRLILFPLTVSRRFLFRAAMNHSVEAMVLCSFHFSPLL